MKCYGINGGDGTSLRKMTDSWHRMTSKQSTPKQSTPAEQKARRVAEELDGYTFKYPYGGGYATSYDGKIEASVWNKYVDEHFNSAAEAKQGKHHVKDYISTADAIRSLNAYYAKGLDKK